MTNKDLITQIIQLYQKANQLTEEFENDAVVRGRRHTISSKVEDLLAGFIQQRLGDSGLRFWVYYALSYTPTGALRAKTIYPDIAVVRRVEEANVVLAIIDVKMDLGWKRDFGTKMPEIAADIKSLRQAKRANRRVPDEEGTKQNESVRISSALKLKYAIMNDGNGSAAAFAANRLAATNHASEIQLYAFTTGGYLGYATASSIEILSDEIDQFIADLKADTSTTHAV